jgi:hypothetical protein
MAILTSGYTPVLTGVNRRNSLHFAVPSLTLGLAMLPAGIARIIDE